MDEPKIRLYPDGVAAWNWELLLNAKKIAGGNTPGTQDIAFTAARAALVKEQARRARRD
jgi:hypothetical protein